VLDQHGAREHLICDFDGTLIRQNLENRLLRHLIRAKLLRPLDYALIPIFTPINLLCSKLERRSIVKVWSAGRDAADLDRLFDGFLDDEAPRIEVNERVRDFVRSFGGRKTLLTGCYQPLAEKWLRLTDNRALFDEVVGSETDWGQFLVSRHPHGRGKVGLLPARDRGVELTGIGNEYADRFFLRLCDHAYIVPGDRLLERLATREGWKTL
jgi:phosphoserine phosphatase